MRGGRSFVSISLSAILLFSMAGFAGAQDRDVDGALAQRYAELARGAVAAGRFDDAFFFAELSLEYDASSSDVQLLAARIVLRLRRPIREAETHLLAALASDRFTRENPLEARKTLAVLLCRMKRYDDAIRLLEGHRDDTDVLYTETVCLRFLGLRERYLADVSDAMHLFPSDVRFPALFLSSLSRDPEGSSPSAAEREILDRLLKRLPFLKRLDADLPLAAAAFMADPETRRSTVLEYRAGGRKSPVSTRLALENGILAEYDALAELLSFGQLSWDDIQSFKEALSSDDAAKAFGEAFLLYDGAISGDLNGDGICETETRYLSASIVSWRLDFDQDGIAEVAAAFSENLPSSVRISGNLGRPDVRADAAGKDLLVEYDPYPFVSRIVSVDHEKIRAFAFEADAYSLDLFSLDVIASGRKGNADAFAYAPVFHADRVPFESSFVQLASRIGDKLNDRETLYGMAGGAPVSAESRRDGYERSRVRYRDGRPVSETVDLDGDGVDEARIGYLTGNDGAQVRGVFELDADFDGLFEYRELLVAPWTRSWDFNADGHWDAVAEPLPDGGERREFSSRMDGILDTAIVARNGRIVTMFRGGKALNFTGDSGGLVTWIGEKPFDFGKDMPSTGAGYRYGVRFSVVSFGDQVFAEVHR
ncbi:MAG: hypothetical protein NT080_13745 [Spirochaetes bacterium]|nr:hypothetical protein [Spirochaetota bacterium]